MFPSYAVQRCVDNRTSVTELQGGICKFQNVQGDCTRAVQVSGKPRLCSWPMHTIGSIRSSTWTRCWEHWRLTPILTTDVSLSSSLRLEYRAFYCVFPSLSVYSCSRCLCPGFEPHLTSLFFDCSPPCFSRTTSLSLPFWCPI